MDTLATTPTDLDHSKITPGDIAIGVIIGRASEYFDYFVYGIASALVFPTVFFPFESGLEATLLSFVVFSFAFIARPIGTIAFMQLERRFGREAKLTVSLFLLGLSTICIAFLPGYNNIGMLAIILLSVLRVGQGLAIGGSWDGLPSLLALNAPKNKRGWYSMLGQLGAPLGFVIASGLFAYLYSSLSLEDFLDWGWRFPFYAAFAINVVALFARLRLVATDEFARLLDEDQLYPSPVMEMFRSQSSTLIIGAFAALASYALFHLVTVFPLSWIRLYSTQSISEFLVVQTIGGGIAMLGIVTSGWLADMVGRRVLLGSLAVCIGVFSVFTPALLGGSTAAQDVFILLGFLLLGLSYGQATGAVTSNLAPRFRYTGAALTADFAWLIGAAFAPLVALGLSANFGLMYASFYLASGAACTLAALAFNRSLEARAA